LKAKHWTLADVNESLVRPIQIQHHVDSAAEKDRNDDPRGQTPMIAKSTRQTDGAYRGNATQKEQPNDLAARRRFGDASGAPAQNQLPRQSS
jgi:hypothetical protein